MPLLKIAAQDGGLTLHEVLTSIPHDAAAVVVYALVGGFIYFVWRGSRKSGETAGHKHG